MSIIRAIGIALVILAILILVGGGAFIALDVKNSLTPPLASAPTSPTSPTSPPRPPAPSLPPNMLFDDEFNGSSIDTSKWDIQFRNSAPHSGVDQSSSRIQQNPFLAYYTPDDAYLNNGNLVLKAENRPYETMPYTSGAIDTAGKFSFLYGKLEVRAKLDKGKGLKPTMWLLGAKCLNFGDCAHWPSPGYDEIDLVEQVGQRPTNIYTTNHFTDSSGQKASKECVNYSHTSYWTGYHTFAVDWTPTQITWYIDGQSVCASTVGIPSHPMFVILNFVVGGPFAQSPGKRTVFPSYFTIDYARVYKNAYSKAYYGYSASQIASTQPLHNQPITPHWALLADPVAELRHDVYQRAHLV